MPAGNLLSVGLANRVIMRAIVDGPALEKGQVFRRTQSLRDRAIGQAGPSFGSAAQIKQPLIRPVC